MVTTTVYRIRDPPSVEADAARTEKLHQRNLQGHPKVVWIDSYQTFSFGNVRDSNRQ